MMLFYQKQSGTRVKLGSLKGENGKNGTNGSNGTGSKGEDGKTAYSNTILPSSNGYITVNKGSAIVGDSITFTFIPNENYILSSYSLINNGIDYKNEYQTVTNEDGSYSCTAIMKENGYVVSAIFSSKENTTSIIDSTDLGNLFNSKSKTINEDELQEVYILNDISVSSYLSITNNNLTIDLNDNTILRNDGTNSSISSVTNLTIENGKLVNNSNTSPNVCISNSNKVNLNNLIIENKSLNNDSVNISTNLSISNSKEVNISNSTIDGGAFGISLFNSENIENKLTLNNVDIKNVITYGLSTNASYTKNATITMNGGSISSSFDALFIPSTGTYTFNNVTFNGYVVVCGGNVTFNNCIFNVNNNSYNISTNEYNINNDNIFSDYEAYSYLKQMHLKKAYF